MDLEDILRHPSVRQVVPPRDISSILSRLSAVEDEIRALWTHEEIQHKKVSTIDASLRSLKRSIEDSPKSTDDLGTAVRKRQRSRRAVSQPDERDRG